MGFGDGVAVDSVLPLYRRLVGGGINGIEGDRGGGVGPIALVGVLKSIEGTAGRRAGGSSGVD